MGTEADGQLTASERGRALQLGYVNGALWSVGNGLTTGTLIFYLAQELGAKGLQLSLLLAAPSLISLLRLYTPALIPRLGGIKRTSVVAFCASYVLLAVGLPGCILVAEGASRRTALVALISLICVHQLLEFIGTVATWAWFAVLVPPSIRGRYFGRRQLIQLAVLIPTLLASGQFVDYWRETYAAGDRSRILIAYGISTTLGAFVLLSSVVPLLMMPDVPWAAGGIRSGSKGVLRAALRDPRFRSYLLYGAWFSFFNGVTQAAQNVYVFVLGIAVLPMQSMQLGMRVGQMVLAEPAGRLSDRFGNRPVMIVSQWCVAAALVFYFLARPETPWWVWGAWLLWSMYVGINICRPNLVLKLAPEGDTAAYMAVFESVGALAYAVSTVAGGLLLDWLRGAGQASADDAARFGWIFLFGAVTRAAGVVLLSRVDEPGAWRVREIIRRGQGPH